MNFENRLLDVMAGAAIGAFIGALIMLSAIIGNGERDIERGWSYLKGEKYFLTLDEDREDTP